MCTRNKQKCSTVNENASDSDKNLEYIPYVDNNIIVKHKILYYCSFCQNYRCTAISDTVKPVLKGISGV
jgi:hypothetical protein